MGQGVGLAALPKEVVGQPIRNKMNGNKVGTQFPFSVEVKLQKLCFVFLTRALAADIYIAIDTYTVI